MRAGVALALLLAVLAPWCAAAESDAREVAPTAAPSIPSGLTRAVRAHMEFLASDALQGRGSGTEYEHKAAEYVAAKLRQYGLQPPAPGGYIQEIRLEMPQPAAPPVLSLRTSAGEVQWTHGREIVVVRLAAAEISGPLQKIDASKSSELPRLERGAFVLLTPATQPGAPPMWKQSSELMERGAAAVLLAKSAAGKLWDARRKSLPKVGLRLEGEGKPLTGERTEVLLGDDAAKVVARLPDGAPLRLHTQLQPAEKERTWNVLGVLPGSDPKLRDEVVLLSAHLDHVGIGKPVAGDKIYNGADDNASGVAVVLELARALAAGPRSKRTLMFAFFGSEEKGGLGSTSFRERPPVPLERIVANLQFEMLGRPDNSIGENTLWLTGYERSDLGPALAAHGARLVADPHPEQNFFERSDNYVLAKKGVVAHTVSSYGMHSDYHQPSDEVEKIDFDHLARAIASLVGPVQWLANSDFRPQWVKGRSP